MIFNLRLKLIVAFVFVIFLCLFLASGAFVYLLRGYQTQVKLSQLEDIAIAMSAQARLLERAGASPEQVSLFLQDQAREVNVRILLLDSQEVVVQDSQGDLKGQQVHLSARLQSQGRLSNSFVYRGNGGNDALFLVISPVRPAPSFTDRFLNRAPLYTVVLAVPQQSVASAWLELIPSLSLAALISLVASVAVAILLSRSISQPISAITKASEEMARGNYDQSIAVSGKDEIGRMALAFNTMAAEVKASHRTLRDFLANVSHELKTPLTSIQGFSQAMIDGTVKDSEGYAAASRIINEEAERMRQLVEDLLYLSKIESGQIPMEKTQVEICALISSCVKKIEIQATRAEVPINVQLDDLPTIHGDAHKLEQVFINLLDNALKHTTNGGAITVKGEVVTGKSGIEVGNNVHLPLVRLAVHNSGSVIPSEELGKVFERFYQANNSRAKSAGGIGLGLAIVKDVVQAHGGFVEVKSEPNYGTEFIVCLPTMYPI